MRACRDPARQIAPLLFLLLSSPPLLSYSSSSFSLCDRAHLIASSSSCTLHRLVFCYRFLFPLFVLFVFLTFLPFLRRGARQECVRVVTLHARSPLSSFFLFLIQHTRAPLKRKEKEKKKKKRGVWGARPPLYKLFSPPSPTM